MWACASLLLLTYRKGKRVKKAFPMYYHLMRYVVIKYIQLRWKIHIVLLQNSLNGD